MHSVAMEELRTPFERDEELLIGIGRVVTVWGAINSLLRSLVARELNCNVADADLVLRRMNSEESKINFVLDLIDARPELDRDAGLKPCLKRLKKRAPDRNIIVHGVPVYGGRKGERPIDHYFLNTRAASMSDQRYRKAKALLQLHLSQIRRDGGVLFEIVNAEAADALLRNAARRKQLNAKAGAQADSANKVTGLAEARRAAQMGLQTNMSGGSVEAE